MVNKGRIHKELGKFFMISSNLIKSNDESMLEIGKFDFMKENLKMNPRNQKSLNLDLISWRNHRMNIGEFFENKNRKKTKLRTKLNQIMTQK